MYTTYHIRIKKEYAAELIEDLQKTDAVELLDKQEDDIDISQGLTDIIKHRIAYYDKNPQELVSWDEVRKRLKL